MGTVAAQKKLFFSLRGIKNRMKILDNGELLPEQTERLSRALDVSKEEIVHMNRRLAARDVSLNAPVSLDEVLEFQDTLVDDRPTPEAEFGEDEEFAHRSKLLDQALATLPKREREILIERRLKDEPATLEDLGKVYGISRERVRQLEARAFDKLQKAIVAAAQKTAAPSLLPASA
jgi:RNA polymerase sigma-32 factor